MQGILMFQFPNKQFYDYENYKTIDNDNIGNYSIFKYISPK